MGRKIFLLTRINFKVNNAITQILDLNLHQYENQIHRYYRSDFLLPTGGV